MATMLKNLVQHFMALSLYENALFYAERLYYENSIAEHLHLLAFCYYRMGKVNQTYLLLNDISHRMSSSDNKYLFALACISLDKLSEAENTLQVLDSHGMPKMTIEAMQRVPGKAAGVYLLGKVCRRQHRRDAAVDYFKLCLHMDPYQWSALVELSELGVVVDVKRLYPVTEKGGEFKDQDLKAGDSKKGKSRSLFNDNEENNPPCNDQLVLPPSADPLLDLSTNVSQANLSYSRRVTSMNLGEFLGNTESCSPPPHSSVALGLSSSSFRMPFGTPTAISSPLVDTRQYQAAIHAHHQQRLREAQAEQSQIFASSFAEGGGGGGMSASKSLINSFSNIQTTLMMSGDHSTASGPGTALGAKNLFTSDLADSFTSANHSQLYNKTTISSVAGSLPDPVDPRATLFGLPTPGLTPINNVSMFNQSYTLGGGSGVKSALGQHLNDELDFDETLDGDLMQSHLMEDSSANSKMPGTAQTNRGGGGGANASRRVSFGPSTGRLSFSGIDGAPARVPITTEEAAERGSPRRERKTIEDESPYKLQRQVSAEADVDIASQRHFAAAAAAAAASSVSHADVTPLGVGAAGPGATAFPASPFPGLSSPIFSHNSHVNFSSMDGPHTVTPAAKKRSHIPRRVNSTSPIPAAHDADEPSTVDRTGLMLVDQTLLLSPTHSVRKNLAAASVVSVDRPVSPRGGVFSPEKRQQPVSRAAATTAGPGEKAAPVATAAAPTSTVPARAAVTAAEKSQAHALLSVFGRAYQLLSLYKCEEAVQLLQSLPLRHFKSGFAQQCVGKAYYECNQYKLSILAFREMLKVEPFRVQGLEILSTAFWHLKRDKDLATLAQQVSEIDRLAPETWCVVGNCFSLQKEPESAIRFFQRAIQLDDSFAYAHTLSGHEQVNNEDLDKAIQSFRLALFANERHYNAWYGLGSIYYRQERYDLSEYHFRRALDINESSSVLHCYLGMALHAQGDPEKSEEALGILEAACLADAKNPQLHFQRAHILLDNGCLEEALQALLVVKEHAPKEPPVHALLGQVYHRLGCVQDALRHLNIAIDLDPKEAATLKAIMEHIDEPVEYA